MVIPEAFKTAIGDKFFDKVITLYNKSETISARGWAKTVKGSTNKTFTGNVRFDKLDQLQKQYGLETEIHALITTHENIPQHSVVGYAGVTYEVMKNVKFDSHYKLLLVIKKN